VKNVRPWVYILITGAVLFFITEEVLRLTNNPNMFPTVVLLGAFVIPVTFIAYFYNHVRDRDISLPLLTTCFIVGGVVGLIVAGVLEYSALQKASVGGLVAVSVIEESAKLLFPLVMYLRWQDRHEADGLLFGIAAGMGFAALETMGYAVVSFIQSQGDINTLQQVLLVRGFLSPAGHAAWTGFICATLWRARERAGRATINGSVLVAFIIAVTLHTLWNLDNSIQTNNAGQLTLVVLGNLAIAAVSLIFIIRRYLEARKDPALMRRAAPTPGGPVTP
jgi:RsiW-degrading membrane proteinase PrsW (M82 family)